MSAKKEKRGGARPNSGPKRSTLSVRQVRDLRKAVEARATREERSIANVLLEVAYDESEPVGNRLAAIKLSWDEML